MALLSPTAGEEFQSPAAIQLTARTTGGASNVEFYADDIFLGAGVKVDATDYEVEETDYEVATDHELTILNLAAGTYLLEARAFDSNQTASAVTSVTVNQQGRVTNVPLSAPPAAAESPAAPAAAEHAPVTDNPPLISAMTSPSANLVMTGSPSQNSSHIIPADRLANWSPNVSIGVPGGIPHRSEIGATVDAAIYGNGDVDASAAIGAAIDACLPGKVVYIPAGTYRIDSGIYRPYARQITIRGAGMGRTILRASGERILSLGTSDWPRPTTGLAIISGAAKGSSTVAVADASAVTVGNLVRIEQDDLPYVISASTPETNTRALSATFRVTSTTATTVTVAPEIPFTFEGNATLVQYSRPPLVNTGIEDMTFDGNGIAMFPIEFYQAWGCWVRGVEVVRSSSRQLFVYSFVNGEIRDSYMHDVVGGGPNHEGIDLYQDCSFNLIENNIVYNGGFPGITLGDSKGGCTGNVIGYNFVYAANTGFSDIAGADISVSHGPHNAFNLVEGNIAGGLASDGYYGSTSHITALRNWLTATHPTATGNLIAVNVGRWNNYFSLVGNVLGSDTFPSNGAYAPTTSFSFNQSVIYKLGFPNMGNSSFSLTWASTFSPDYRLQTGNYNPGGQLQELDLNVHATLLRHGNFDYLTRTTNWEPTISDQSIPTSLYYQSKPAWWPMDVAFPPIGPDVAPVNGGNPAYRRYKAMGTGLPTP